MGWLLRLSIEPTIAEIVVSELWSFGTTGVFDDGETTVAGFATEGEARAAGAAVTTADRERPITVLGVEPAPGPEHWAADTGIEQVAVPGTAVSFPITVGASFGHGRHPTTAVALSLLAEQAERGRLGTVVDFGTGTGILAIAAALLGADRVVAIDNDPAAVAQAKANATSTGVDDRVEVRHGSTEVVEPAFDLGLVNVLLPVHQLIGPTVRSALAEGGQIICAGILDSQIEALTSAYRPLVALSTRQASVGDDDNWVGCLLTDGADGPGRHSSTGGG